VLNALAQNVTESHNIVPNGYDIGRDRLVANAVANPKFQGVSYVATAVGNTSFDGVHYTSTLKQLKGLLAAGSQGVNHGLPLVLQSSGVRQLTYSSSYRDRWLYGSANCQDKMTTLMLRK
jgi:hypothetical protein